MNSVTVGGCPVPWGTEEETAVLLVDLGRLPGRESI